MSLLSLKFLAYLICKCYKNIFNLTEKYSNLYIVLLFYNYSYQYSIYVLMLRIPTQAQTPVPTIIVSIYKTIVMSVTSRRWIQLTWVVSWNCIHGEVYSIQHYVIKFASDLWQVSGGYSGFLHSSTNKSDCHDITEILVSVA